MTYVRAKRCRRHGTCDWCKSPDVPLNVIYYTSDGSYFIAEICKHCYERKKWEVFHNGSELDQC